MYLPLARATSRIVWPGVAAMTSPSMRTFTFSVKGSSLSFGAANVGAQATERLLERRHRCEPERNLGIRPHSLGGRHLGGYMAADLARRLGRHHLVGEFRDQAGETLQPHQALVDVAGGLLADAPRVRNVRGAGDEVAARIEAIAARLEGVAVHLERASLLDRETRGLAEVGIDLLADGQDDRVAFDADHFVGRDRIAAAGRVELARLRLDRLESLYAAGLVADDAVRCREVEELGALVLGGQDLLGDRRHVLPLPPVDDREVCTQAARRAGGVDRGVAASDDHDLLADRHLDRK